jgi:hypothetical protein
MQLNLNRFTHFTFHIVDRTARNQMNLEDILMVYLFSTGSLATVLMLLVLICTPFSVQRITGSEVSVVTNQVVRATIWNDSEPEGFMIGKFFIAYMRMNTTASMMPTKELYLFGRYKKSSTATLTIHSSPNSRNRDITVLDREGPYFALKYSRNPYMCRDYLEFDQQRQIIDDILADFGRRSYCTVLLTGDTGVGKSMIGVLLAQRLIDQRLTKQVFITDSFCPTDPNDSFVSLYQTVNPTADRVLIVALEEVDQLITRIISEDIVPHKYYSIAIRNKTDWNNFFDKFDRMRWPHVIFIMTSNQDLSFFERLDSSLVRDNRVNVKRTMRRQ